MICIISSAKSLNLNEVNLNNLSSTEYDYFAKDFLYIKNLLSNFSVEEVQKILKLSTNLALLNYNRFQNFDKSSKYKALFLYYGDVYRNLNPFHLKVEELNFLQNHLRIISALYGMVRPLDKILPYRLEMNTKLSQYNLNLNEFWSNKITNQINSELNSHKEKYLLNLASKEYSSVISNKLLAYPMINIEFRQKFGSQTKNIGLHAKKARGIMLNYIAKKKIDKLESLKNFSELGYLFDNLLSNEYNMYFVKIIR